MTADEFRMQFRTLMRDAMRSDPIPIGAIILELSMGLRRSQDTMVDFEDHAAAAHMANGILPAKEIPPGRG